MANDMICLDVINTMWYDYRGTGRSEDRLTNPKWIEYFIKDWNLTHLSYPSAQIIHELQNLRQLMRDILQKTTQDQLPTADELIELNTFMDKAKRSPVLIKRDNHFELNLVADQQNWDTFISEIALSFSELFTKAEYKRVKFCKNEDCRWVFHDNTKNGHKHWCSSETCGNLSRVRKHRDTLKEEKQ
ncbi:CGNR zinc finger domain-containing protein [Bacillus sp. SD088]|uniref:CGNR zinc finger domain-containing protein n=1 Tax=Bacillus sp. SD088 TaxID=2782012 RepID=UPI001A956850|nr:CGNR zinc finger domain-containing protein [Bacillus sp. SD088]MBO0994383.1 CGNR zinc finger domain-containing protein [Bacillus sp. SD088]